MALPKKKSLVKQQLCDLEHKFTMDIGALLVLLSEGTAEQAALANQKTHSDLLKFGPDMQKLAKEAGGSLPKTVQEYLESVDSIVHSASGWIDEAKITRCYNMTQKLQKELEE